MSAMLRLASSRADHPESRVGRWILTHTGKAYYPIDPQAQDVCIEDIAHALSHLCRYAGHCDRFYSVAEHSVLVSLCVPPEHALPALLHDATEAYVVDLPTPVKEHCPEYMAIEARNWECIAAWAGIDSHMHYSIKDADVAVLLAERKALFAPGPSWGIPGEPANVKIRALAPKFARGLFLARYHQLTGSRNVS